MRILFGLMFLMAMAVLYEGTASAAPLPNCPPGFRLHNGHCRHVLFQHPVYRVPHHPVPYHPAPAEPQPR